MSGLADLRKEAFKALQKTGVIPPHISAHVPSKVMEAWKKRFFRRDGLTVDITNPRLLNHFQLGADPEFSFRSGEGNEAVPATHMSLQAALAFGADNNGRLVELRPEPSRFALRVVASMLLEMHWMVKHDSRISRLLWKGGAWDGHDGLGGHVHFGRKRTQLRKLEVDALANCTKVLRGVGLYNPAEMESRLVHTQYGQLDDFRPQRHGYEYRALPSWIGSPWQAFVSLTAAKLVVYNPALMEEADQLPSSNFTPKLCRSILNGIFAYYKDLDDDARIAYLGAPYWGYEGPQTKDVRAAWRVEEVPPTGLKEALKERQPSLLFPTSIEPDEKTVENLLAHLIKGDALNKPNLEKPTWEYWKAPDGFVPCQGSFKTVRSPGLGEATWDLLMPEPFVIDIQWLEGPLKRPTIQFNRPLWHLVGDGRIRQMRETYPEYDLKMMEGGNYPPSYTQYMMRLSKRALESGMLDKTRALLASNLLPLYRFGDEGRFNPLEWQSHKKKMRRKWSQAVFVT